MPSIQIVAPRVEFITPKFWDTWNIDAMKLMEECGRVSHKSEGRITPDSAAPFLKSIAIRMGHESIIEHAGFTACFIGSRSMSHQLVRHRLAAITQESQRYCDYSSDKKAPDETLQVIMPPSIMNSKALWGKTISEVHGMAEMAVVGTNGQGLRLFLNEVAEKEDLSGTDIEGGFVWCKDQLNAYKAYLRDRDRGVPSEDARSHLTNACKTEVYVTYNFRMWRHVLGHPNCGRALNDHAQWEIRMITYAALEMFREALPDLFMDLGTKITFDKDELAIIRDFLGPISVEQLDEAFTAYDMNKTARDNLTEKLAQMEVTDQ